MIHPSRHLRALALRLGRNTAFPRRLHQEIGGAKFLASTEGGLKVLRRDTRKIDPLLSAFAAAYVREGSVVWDVGANVGLFTFMAAGLSGPRGTVLAIEPDLWLVQLLRRSVRLNNNSKSAQVVVVPSAAHSEPGALTFMTSAHSRAMNTSSADRMRDGQSRERLTVPKVTLDSLLKDFATPGIIKIDVEGADSAVIEGAMEVLDTARPVILIEADFNSRAHRLVAREGYTVVDAVEHLLHHPSTKSRTQNLLCIPEATVSDR